MPSLWIIDGYNFIRQSRRFAELEARDGTRGKEAALRWLGEFQAQTGERVRVVFDAYSGLASEPTVGKKFEVEVWLSRGSYTADEEIVALAKDLGQACIVISSDREIREGAVKSGASILDSEEFEREVAKILERHPEAEDDRRKSADRPKGRAFHPPKEKKKAYQLLRKYQ